MEEPDRSALNFADVVIDETVAVVLVFASQALEEQEATLQTLYSASLGRAALYIIVERSSDAA